MAYQSTPNTEIVNGIARAERGIQILDVPEFGSAVRFARAVSAKIAFVDDRYDGWTDQLFRASTSIGANIAEALGRNTDAQIHQYTRIARGSAYECLALLQYPPADLDVSGLETGCRECCGLLDAAVIRYATARLN